MSEPVLEVRGLRVAYGPVDVVHGIDLVLARGEAVALVGPNGAGKSTTLAAITRHIPAKGGDVLLSGRSLLRDRPEDVARAGVALVPEGRHLFTAMSVAENLQLGLTARRDHDGLDADRAWVEELFPVVRDFAHRRAGDLSGGQQQQVAIARALLARPDVLLLDEPSLGLAPKTIESVFEAIAQIRSHGVTVLLVEQRAQLAVAFCDRTYVIAAGAHQATLTREDADDTDRIIGAYFGS